MKYGILIPAAKRLLWCSSVSFRPAARCFSDLSPSFSVSSIAQPDPHQQSFLLPGDARIRASKFLEDPFQLVSNEDPIVQNINDVIHHGMVVSGNGDCLGSRSGRNGRYEWISYQQAIEDSNDVGAGFLALGLTAGNDTLVGLYCNNCIEHVLAQFGCSAFAMPVVPLYDTLGECAISYIINEAGLSTILCDSEAKVKCLVQKARESPTLKTLVVTKPISSDILREAQSYGLTVVYFDDLKNLGQKQSVTAAPASLDGLFSIMYTSGTTGTPKGVMITHGNVIAAIAGIRMAMGPAKYKMPGTFMSYLPIAHVYECCNQLLHFYSGSRVAFYNGDMTRLMDDIKELRPTILPMVPRLMNRIHQQVMQKVSSNQFKKTLLRAALRSKQKQMGKGHIDKETVWDRLLLRKIRAVTGGSVQVITSSSAPVTAEVLNFCRTAFGCYVFEVYGQTEVGAATMNLPNATDGGHVGAPLPHCHVKLIDVPEMNYYAADDVGEICVRGSSVTPGYFKNPAATEEAKDPEGWFRTGDIGRWLPNGTLAVIDRKKHIFKLSQGEYIAPEKIENIYSQSSLLLQIFVDGFTDQNYVVAIAVVDQEAFTRWGRKRGLDVTNIEDDRHNKKVRAALLFHLQKIGQKNALNALEQVKNVHILTKPFTIQDGLLTPTMKLKRPTLRTEFNSVFCQMYEEGPLLRTVQT